METFRPEIARERPSMHEVIMHFGLFQGVEQQVDHAKMLEVNTGLRELSQMLREAARGHDSLYGPLAIYAHRADELDKAEDDSIEGDREPATGVVVTADVYGRHVDAVAIIQPVMEMLQTYGITPKFGYPSYKVPAQNRAVRPDGA